MTTKVKPCSTRRRGRGRRRRPSISVSRRRRGGDGGGDGGGASLSLPSHLLCPVVPRADQLRTGCALRPETKKKAAVKLAQGGLEKAARASGAAEKCGRKARKGSRASCVLENAGLADAEALVPAAPASWDRKPEEWLTNLDIDGFLHYLAKHDSSILVVPSVTIDFDGPAAGGRRGAPGLSSSARSAGPAAGQCYSAELCALDFARDVVRGGRGRGLRHVLVSMNLGEYHTSGYHWVSVYAYAGGGGPGGEAPFMYYFDSAQNGGAKFVPESVKRLHARWAKGMGGADKFRLERNATRHQEGNNNCGVYSVYFFALMASPLNEPLRFPVRRPPSSPAEAERQESRLYPLFRTQHEKLAWLEQNKLSDAEIQYYRDVFFS